MHASVSYFCIVSFFSAFDCCPFQYDKKNKRGFLKRCEYPTVQMKDIFVGATISVYSRQLKVVDYADEFTAKAYGPKRSRYAGAH